MAQPIPNVGDSNWGPGIIAVMAELQGVMSRTGSGFPEGVTAAPVGTRYTDSAATMGAVEWIKVAGTGNTGWRVAWGDTGWRDVTSLAPAGTFPTAPNAGFGLMLRRVNDKSFLWLGDGTFGSSGAPIAANTSLLDIPAGFRHARPTSFVPVPAYNVTAVAWLSMRLSSTPDKLLSQSVLNGVRAQMNVEWSTDDTWPTSLPGTAAA